MESKPLVIADPGSCHLGDLNKAFELMDVAKDIGVDIIKFQLFKGKEYIDAGNYEINDAMWAGIYEYGEKIGMPVAASVFDERLLIFLVDHYDIPFIKFGFPKKHKTKWFDMCEREGMPYIVSQDVMSDTELGPLGKNLYCISEYPVRHPISFVGLFPRFDGFSDHTLGWHETFMSMHSGAKIIEKHIKLEDQLRECPDARFALEPSKFKDLIQWRNKNYENLNYWWPWLYRQTLPGHIKLSKNREHLLGSSHDKRSEVHSQ